MSDVGEIRFDTPRGCARELADVNREIQEFQHEWATDAGRLKEREGLYERLYRSAMRGLKDTKGTVQEKAAIAHLAIGEIEGGTNLAEEIEELQGRVERHKTMFKALERRSSNAQSILGMHRDEAKLAPYADVSHGKRRA